MPDPIRTRGSTAHTTPAIQHGHRANKRGTPTHRRGTPHTRRRGQQHSRPSLIMPPTIHYAGPPSTTAPPSTTTRGERTEDTPPHEQHRHTLATHTPRTRQGTVRDMTAVLTGTAVGRVGHEPYHCTGQDNSSTYHRHSAHRGGWTPSTHPLIYSHSFMFTQPTNDHDQ